MLFAAILGAFCTALLTVNAAQQPRTKEIFYSGDTRSRTGPAHDKSVQRTQWLANAFHETLFDSLAIKVNDLASQIKSGPPTNENFEQVWAAYADSVMAATAKRLAILKDGMRKVHVRGAGVPVNTEAEAFSFFRGEVTQKTLDQVEEAEDKEADKKKVQRKKETELRKKEKEIKEVKREAKRRTEEQDHKVRRQRGFTYADSGHRKRSRRTSDSDSDSDSE